MDIVEFMKTHGLPWAGMAIAAYAFWVQVVIPGRDRHFQFLDKIESAMVEMAKTQTAIMREVAELVQRVEGDSKNGKSNL
jgi:hypothetical protein